LADILRTVDLRKSFPRGRSEVEVLRGVNLAVREGEFVAVMGPSGCGKSTLLYILGGLARPTSGKVFFGSKSIYDRDGSGGQDYLRRQVGFVFQRFNLLPTLSAFDNVRLALKVRGNGGLREEVKEILSAVGLEGKMHHRPSELSTGEEQRVAIARALVFRPRLILADEPTGNLDSENARAVLGLLKKVHEDGQTIIMVTHNLEAASTAQRIVRMLDGRIL